MWTKLGEKLGKEDAVSGCVFFAAALLASTACGPQPQDPETGTLHGSPLDQLPPEVTQLTAFNHRGGEVMGVHLKTGEIRAYSQSPWFDEADGVFPDGHSTLVTRELARVLIPHDLDLWRLSLDGDAHWRRLTRFNRYEGYGVSNSAVSPDGRHVVFQLRRSDAPPGNGLGLMLMDLGG